MTKENVNTSKKYNSCGRRGCTITHRILPRDGRVQPIHSQVHGFGNDIKKIFYIIELPMDKMEEN